MIDCCSMPLDWKDFKRLRLRGAARRWVMVHPLYSTLTQSHPLINWEAPTELLSAVKPHVKLVQELFLPLSHYHFEGDGGVSSSWVYVIEVIPSELRVSKVING